MGMRIREENCNMVLLAVVTLFTAAIAGGASLVGSNEKNPIHFADRSARVEPVSSERQTSTDRTVRVVGAPFVPNTKPHER